MNDEAPAHYQHRLRELSDGYLLRVATGVKEATIHFDNARKGDATALRAIIMIVHRASGSGGMLGFPQISHLASTLEMLLRQANDADLDFAGWHEIERQLRCLQEAISTEQQTRACD